MVVYLSSLNGTEHITTKLNLICTKLRQIHLDGGAEGEKENIVALICCSGNTQHQIGEGGGRGRLGQSDLAESHQRVMKLGRSWKEVEQL